MAPTHELQLMLVNTLRKVCEFCQQSCNLLTHQQDLESDSIARICLALDNVAVSSNEDLIPAVQSRLHDLLSHTSSVCILKISLSIFFNLAL